MKTKPINFHIQLFFLFIILNNFNQYVTSSETHINISNENNICNYVLADGKEINLKILRNTVKDYSFNYNRYEYRANFCGPLIRGCPKSAASAGVFVNNGIINTY